MKERPILFSAPMINAILAGQKHQTRRIVKNGPTYHVDGRWTFTMSSTDRKAEGQFCYGVPDASGHTFTDRGTEKTIFRGKCPFGRVGDHLWVREIWRTWEEEFSEPVYDDDTGQLADEINGSLRFVAYRATPRIGKRAAFGAYPDERITFLDEGTPLDSNRELLGPWRPSIYMPRWASRIALEVTGVRIERLNDISEDDAKSEGAPRSIASLTPEGEVRMIQIDGSGTYREGFAGIWCEINGVEAWDANPWVWCISFRRIEC